MGRRLGERGGIGGNEEKAKESPLKQGEGAKRSTAYRLVRKHPCAHMHAKRLATLDLAVQFDRVFRVAVDLFRPLKTPSVSTLFPSPDAEEE